MCDHHSSVIQPSASARSASRDARVSSSSSSERASRAAMMATKFVTLARRFHDRTCRRTGNVQCGAGAGGDIGGGGAIAVGGGGTISATRTMCAGTLWIGSVDIWPPSATSSDQLLPSK